MGIVNFRTFLLSCKSRMSPNGDRLFSRRIIQVMLDGLAREASTDIPSSLKHSVISYSRRLWLGEVYFCLSRLARECLEQVKETYLEKRDRNIAIARVRANDNPRECFLYTHLSVCACRSMQQKGGK